MKDYEKKKMFCMKKFICLMSSNFKFANIKFANFVRKTEIWAR